MIVRPLYLTFLFAFGAVTLVECAAPSEASARAECVFARDDAGKPPQPSIKIAWELSADPKSGKAWVNVTGLDSAVLTVLRSPKMTASRWSSFFSVRVAGDALAKPDLEEAPPLWGAYEIRESVIRFVPRFAPEPGIRYRARFDLDRLRSVLKELDPSIAITDSKATAARLTSDFSLAKQPVEPTTRISTVYPSANQLPENLLRFYIHFSSPMSRGEAYRHLKLLDAATKKPVHAPFLELEEELWSPDGTRFTLFIDPGRIKRGLTPREMFGPVLEAGKSYCLIVDRGWLDASGNPLQSEYRRTFRAGPPDESMPEPKKWSLAPPRAGARDAMVVRFPEPLDRGLLERVVGVLDPKGHLIPGAISIAEAETVWRFVPEDPWRPGNYRLSVGSELEDVAGNSVGSPFEVDMTSPITKRVKSERVEVPFAIADARGSH